MNGGGISSTNSDNEQEAEQTGIRCSFVQQTAGTPGFLRAKAFLAVNFLQKQQKQQKTALGRARYLQFTR
jgi:hypothetical protein